MYYEFLLKYYIKHIQKQNKHFYAKRIINAKHQARKDIRSYTPERNQHTSTPSLFYIVYFTYPYPHPIPIDKSTPQISAKSHSTIFYNNRSPTIKNHIQFVYYTILKSIINNNIRTHTTKQPKLIDKKGETKPKQQQYSIVFRPFNPRLHTIARSKVTNQHLSTTAADYIQRN